MTGDREIDSINRQSKSTPLRDPTQITITDTLKYTFEAVDHNQVIRCLTVGPWLTENDPHEATAHLNVICKHAVPILSAGMLLNTKKKREIFLFLEIFPRRIP